LSKHSTNFIFYCIFCIIDYKKTRKSFKSDPGKTFFKAKKNILKKEEIQKAEGA